MWLYSAILFAVSLLLIILGILIRKGKTDLIHSYHREKVTDHEAYGKAFGKALFAVGAAPLVSGIIALCGDSDRIAAASLAVLFLGLAIGIGCIIAVQKKYNNGIF